MPRNFNEAVLFNIYFIRPVEDPHEVLFHLMEAMVVTLQLSRGLPLVCARLFVDRLIHLNIRGCHSQDLITRSLRWQLVLHFPYLLSYQIQLYLYGHWFSTPRRYKVDRSRLHLLHGSTMNPVRIQRVPLNSVFQVRRVT